MLRDIPYYGRVSLSNPKTIHYKNLSKKKVKDFHNHALLIDVFFLYYSLKNTLSNVQ